MCSFLELLEFEGRLARKVRFHSFNSRNLKEASHESFVFTNHGCDLTVRIGTKHCIFSGKRRFRCGEKLARVRDGCGCRRFAVKSCSNCARSGTDGSRWFFLFFDDAVLLILHVLRHFVHWNCCIQAMCSTVARCNSIVFCNSVSADRSGLAAPTFLASAAASVILCNTIVPGTSGS